MYIFLFLCQIVPGCLICSQISYCRQDQGLAFGHCHSWFGYSMHFLSFLFLIIEITIYALFNAPGIPGLSSLQLLFNTVYFYFLEFQFFNYFYYFNIFISLFFPSHFSLCFSFPHFPSPARTFLVWLSRYLPSCYDSGGNLGNGVIRPQYQD